MNSYKKTYENWRWFLLVLAVFLLRLPTLWTPLLDIDESIFAVCAEVIRQGGVLYRDCIDHQPPGIYWLFSGIFSLFGSYNMVAVHGVTSLIVFLTAAILWKIGRQLADDQAGFWVGFLYVIFSTTHIPKYISTNIETVVNLPLVLMGWSVTHQFVARSSWQKLRTINDKPYYGMTRWLDFLAGILGGVAILFKYQAGLIVLSLLLLAFRPRRLVAIGLGGIFLVGIVVGKMFLDGNLDPFFQETLLRGWQYARLGDATNPFWPKFLGRFGLMVATSLPLWWLSFYSLASEACSMKVRGHQSRCFESSETVKEHPQDRNGIGRNWRGNNWMLVSWFLMALVAASMGARFYPHYFILLLPPLCLLAGPCVASFWREGGRFKRYSWLVLISCWALLFLGLRWDVQKTYRWFYQNHASLDSGIEPMMNEATYRAVGDYLKENSLPSDRIVVWGFADPIYVFSKRLPGSRFIWADDLTGRVPGAPRTWEKGFDTSSFIRPGLWEIFLKDLEKNRPLWFVDTASAGLNYYGKYPIQNYPRLMDLLGKNYQKETTVAGVDLYLRRE